MAMHPNSFEMVKNSSASPGLTDSLGIHGVLVRIRDDDLKTMPGVRVEDMG